MGGARGSEDFTGGIGAQFNSILKALFDIFYSMQKSLSSSMIKSMQQPLDLYSRRCREEHGMGL